MRPIPLLLVASLALGCAADPIAPRTAPVDPQLQLAQAAAEFPNVIRVQDYFVFGIQDPSTDLLAVAGLPDDPPRTWFYCGGTDFGAVVDLQFAGVLKSAINTLMKGSDVNIDVYRRSTFFSICDSPVLAHGKGRVMYVDNALEFIPGKLDSYGFRIEGPVTLAASGTAMLLAHNRWHILPDGTPQLIFRKVNLLGP